MVELSVGIVFLSGVLNAFGGPYLPIIFTGMMVILSVLSIKTKNRKFIYFGFVVVGSMFVISFFHTTIYGVGPMLQYIITSQDIGMRAIYNLGQSTVPSIILLFGFLNSKKHGSSETQTITPREGKTVNVTWQVVFMFITPLNIWAFYRIKKLTKAAIYALIPSFLTQIVWYYHFFDPIKYLVNGLPYINEEGAIIAKDPILNVVLLITFGIFIFTIYLGYRWSKQWNKQLLLN